MFIGLLIFLSGHRHFQSTRVWIKKRSRCQICLTCMELVSGDALFSAGIFTLLLENDWSGYLLAIVCLFAAQIIARMMIKFPEHRRALANRIADACRDAVLGAGATGRQYHQLVYRSLRQIVVFNIEVPTALFQSVNAIAVMLGWRGAGVAGAQKAAAFSCASG